MLSSLFHWLDRHPGSYWLLVAAATVPLVARVWGMIKREASGPAAPPSTATWRDGLWLFLLILAWRWPFLLVAYDYNPDESQMIAGSLTLVRDPVFWRAVDGGSSGPLNYYLLVPWHWFGLPLDYFTARLTCLLLTWGALFACLRSLARSFGLTAAWLGILPATAFFATVTQPELTNLSTEQLPVLLIAVAFGLLAGRTPPERWRLWAACVAAGALPWTKLQSAPIGLALIGWAWWHVLREPGLRWRRSGEILLAAAFPTFFFTSLAAATGQWEAIWRRFFLSNIAYVGTGTAPSGGEALRSLWHNAWDDGSFPLFLALVSVGLFAAAVALIRRRERPSALVIAGATVTLAALAAVIAPRRDYLHYVLLLPVPFTLWFGAALGDWWRQLQASTARRALAGIVLVAGLLPLVGRGLNTDAPIYGGFSHHWKYPRTSVGAVVHALAGRDDTLGIWGWACALHVECALPQATRDANTAASIEDNPQLAYYRAVYLADLQRQPPAVFVDAVGPGAFVFTDRVRQAHEIFPELAGFIRRNYTLVLEQPDARVYARNGLPALREMNDARLRQLVLQGRDPERFLLSLSSGGLDPLERRRTDKDMVVLLPPSARLEWSLDAGVGAFAFELGCDPEAMPTRGSDAGFTFEIVNPTGTRTLLERVLDPAHQARDRGRQSAQVTLPPFAPGSVLVLRTDPARNGLHLSGLRLLRTPRPVSK